MQSIGLGAIALILGPILALVFVSLISQHASGSTDQAALSLVAGQPVQAIFSVAFYALATVIVVVATMALMLWFAARKNALFIRREAARTTQRPLWQRLNLDAVTAVIALVGFGASLYLVSLNNLFDARTRVLDVAPLTLIAPLFLLIAFLFLFLRFSTVLLALGAGFAMRSRSAISMLALAQMATVGFTESGVSSGTTLSIPIEIRAVDAHTFVQTGIWSSPDSSTSLAALMSQLVDVSGIAIKNDQVPVIIDAAVAHRLDLQTGNLFAVNVNNLPNSSLNCLVVAIVQHIPTVNSSDTSGTSGTYVAPGGILLDYTTYAAVYTHDVLVKSSASDAYLPIKHVWLSTSNDESSLASVREALKTPGLRLQNLYDRRLLIATMSSDPLYLSLIIVLTIGSATALLLALVGCLLASWLNVRNRLTSFAVMRALWIMAHVALRPSMSQTLRLNQD